MGIHQHYPQPPAHNFPFELNKDFSFSAAHYIPNELAGPCQNMHGHEYSCNLTVVGEELDEMGFLVNFSDLKKLVHGRFDHKLINELVEFSPSTEKMAEEIHRVVSEYLVMQENKPQCIQVLLRETSSSYVVYRPKN